MMISLEETRNEEDTMWWWDMTKDERTEALEETGVQRVVELDTNEALGVNLDDLDEVLVMVGERENVEDLAHRLAVCDYVLTEVHECVYEVATYHS